MSFANLKRNRTDLSSLVQAAEKAGGGQTQRPGQDPRMWQPTRDKAGNGYAVIRFLPGVDDAGTPWARYWDHGFKGPTGQWYIENSLTSIGQPDPVGELNSRLWNSGNDADKETARAQKRRLHYVTNVLVVSDPSAPHNEGKVMLYKFGKKIFDKLMDVMQPSFADETPVNPFDMWEGADFKLKIRNVEGYRNYDKSEFASASPLMEGDDSKLESVFNGLHELSEFNDPKNYKSYDELKAKLMRVLGEREQMGAPTMAQESMMNEPVATPMPTPVQEPITADTMDGDDTMSYFAKLANED